MLKKESVFQVFGKKLLVLWLILLLLISLSLGFLAGLVVSFAILAVVVGIIYTEGDFREIFNEWF